MSLKKYLVKCITEDQFVSTGYLLEPPTVCPNNNTHTIDTDRMPVIDTISDSTVVLKKILDVPRRKTKGNIISVPAVIGESIVTITFPYNINLYEFTIHPTTENLNDTLEIRLSNGNFDATLVSITGSNVTMTNVDNIHLGYELFVDDGVNREDLGKVVYIDEVSKTVVSTIAAVNSYSVGTTLEVMYVVLESYTFVYPEPRNLQEDSAVCIPAGSVIDFVYNNTTASAKTLHYITSVTFDTETHE